MFGIDQHGFGLCDRDDGSMCYECECQLETARWGKYHEYEYCPCCGRAGEPYTVGEGAGLEDYFSGFADLDWPFILPKYED